MKKVLPYISALIILSGLLIYLKWNMDDYNRGVAEINQIGSEKNNEVNAQKVNTLLNQNHPEDAINLLIKMIEADENKDNLINQLKLSKLYCNACKKNFLHCEDALWQLNAILGKDSTNLPAKEMLQDLNIFLDTKNK